MEINYVIFLVSKIDSTYQDTIENHSKSSITSRLNSLTHLVRLNITQNLPNGLAKKSPES